MNRRHILKALGAGALLGAGGYAWSTYPANIGPLPKALIGDRLFDDIIAFDAIGVHRTATPEDRSTTLWLESHLKRQGFATQRQAFTVRQFYPDIAQVSIGGANIPIHPQWPVMSSTFVDAPLARLDDKPASGDWIALLVFPYEQRASIKSVTYAALLAKAKQAGAVAAIAITEGPTNEIIVMNAPDSHTPLALPTVLVAPKDAALLQQAASRHARVRLNVTGQVDPAAKADNLIGIIDRGTPWIVISTPQSAWTKGAGERGPGIALWRGFAEVLAARSNCSLMFIATSGHELGHAGADRLLPRVTPIIQRNGLDCWLHLGANIATRDFVIKDNSYRLRSSPARSRYLTASPSLLAPLAWSFTGEPGLTPLPAVSGKLAGETATILAHGFSPVAGLFGSSLFHHTALDRPSEATNPQMLEAVAYRLIRFIQYVDRQSI